MARSSASAALALATLFAFAHESSARADEADVVARARDAYDRGVRERDRGDDEAAARAFAEADAIAPTEASLEAALESTLRADDPALGSDLLERSTGRHVDRSLAATMGVARARFAGRAGKIRVDCAGAQTCVLAVDGVAFDGRKIIFARVGPHSVVLQRDSDHVERLIDVRADRDLDLPEAREPAIVPPPSSSSTTPPDAPHSQTGLSPTWFWIAAGATVLVTGFTVASGIDALHQHDRFNAGNCGVSASAGSPFSAACDDLTNSGKNAQTRTNVLIGASAALGAATAVVGLFFVRWSSGASASFALGFAPSAPGASLNARF